MDIQDFVTCIQKGEIPPEPPDYLVPGGRNSIFRFTEDDYSWQDYWAARDECTRRGMWAIVDKRWVRVLADWIGERTVLEVMAGNGWLAKALHEAGVNIVATDDYSWDDRHTAIEKLYQVHEMSASQAVATIPADILLVSWPPMDAEDLTNACRLWGNKKPIIYIGEGYGGCNGPDSFHEFFVDDGYLEIPMVSWDSIHDTVAIGHWGE